MVKISTVLMVRLTTSSASAVALQSINRGQLHGFRQVAPRQDLQSALDILDAWLLLCWLVLLSIISIVLLVWLLVSVWYVVILLANIVMLAIWL